MPQRRYWNFKDDDSTFDLNFRELGILEPGRYRGFDPVLVAGLSLELAVGATAITKTLLDPLTTADYGVWYTKQGAVITETDSIFLPINANVSGNPRIDLIVGQHQYVATVGGAAALYSVIQGTPAANPVAPGLTLPNEQVILGQLFVPAGMSSLTDAGVVYTQAAIPDLANDSTVIHGDRTNDFTSVQIFRSQEEYVGSAELDIGAVSDDLVLEDGSGNADSDRNYYVVNPSAVPPTPNWIINTISVQPTPIGAANMRRVTFYTPISLLLSSGGVFDRDYYIKAESAFTVVFETGAVRIVEADEANQGSINKFWRQQILRYPVGGGSLSAGGFFTLSSNQNMYVLGNTVTSNQLRGIQASSAYDAASSNGGFVWLTLSNNDLEIVPFDFTGAPNFKPIWTPNQASLYFRSASTILLVEDAVYWRLVDCFKGWATYTGFSVTAFGGGTVSIPGVNTSYRYSVDGNACRIEFHCNTFAVSSTVNQILLSLPPGIVPANPTHLLGVQGAYSTGGAGAFPHNGVVVETRPGNQLALYSLGGSFSVVAGEFLGFSIEIEIVQP